MCLTTAEGIFRIDTEMLFASKDTLCDNESGATSIENAATENALIRTVQCVTGVPRINLWI